MSKTKTEESTSQVILNAVLTARLDAYRESQARKGFQITRTAVATMLLSDALTRVEREDSDGVH